MRKLIDRFGFRRVLTTAIVSIVVLTIALAGTAAMAVKTQHQLNSWVTFTMN